MSYDIDHPTLPAGYNSVTIDGDMMNGPGINEPVWPEITEGFQPMIPLIVVDEMLEVFEKACPDYVVPCQTNSVTFPRATRELRLKEVA